MHGRLCSSTLLSYLLLVLPRSQAARSCGRRPPPRPPPRRQQQQQAPMRAAEPPGAGDDACLTIASLPALRLTRAGGLLVVPPGLWRAPPASSSPPAGRQGPRCGRHVRHRPGGGGDAAKRRRQHRRRARRGASTPCAVPAARPDDNARLRDCEWQKAGREDHSSGGLPSAAAQQPGKAWVCCSVRQPGGVGLHSLSGFLMSSAGGQSFPSSISRVKPAGHICSKTRKAAVRIADERHLHARGSLH